MSCAFDFISLMISYIEYLFIYMLAIYLSSLKKCLFTFTPHFNQIVISLPLNCMNIYIFQILAPYLIYNLKIFLPVIRLPYHFIVFLCRSEAFQFHVVPLDYLASVSFAFHFRFIKLQLRFMSVSLLLMFSYRIFMVLGH